MFLATKKTLARRFNLRNADFFIITSNYLAVACLYLLFHLFLLFLQPRQSHMDKASEFCYFLRLEYGRPLLLHYDQPFSPKRHCLSLGVLKLAQKSNLTSEICMALSHECWNKKHVTKCLNLSFSF